MMESVAAPFVKDGTLINTTRESHNTRRHFLNKNACRPPTPPLHSVTPHEKLLVLASIWKSYNKCLAHSLATQLQGDAEEAFVAGNTPLSCP